MVIIFWTSARLLTSHNVKLCLTVSLESCRSFMPSPTRRVYGQCLPGIFNVRVIRIQCWRSAIEEISANSPYARMARGTRVLNKCSLICALYSVARFSAGRVCSGGSGPHHIVPVPVARNAPEHIWIQCRFMQNTGLLPASPSRKWMANLLANS